MNEAPGYLADLMKVTESPDRKPVAADSGAFLRKRATGSKKGKRREVVK